MSIQVTGKNVDASDAYQAYIADKIASVLSKYIGPEIVGHVRLEKERGQFRTSCAIRLKSGLLLEGEGEGGDAYASADAALEHLEKRVRRHRRRLKSHHSAREPNIERERAVSDVTVRLDESDDEETGDAAYPVIVAEQERRLSEMPVSEAVMQLDLTQSAFLVFRNASHGDVNIVYRRPDGHIGWIDLRTGTDAGKVANGTDALNRIQS